jgi:hypothetical protein
MGIIKIYEKAGKTKRKPGWQKVEAEYKAWLKSVSTMSSGIAKPKTIVATKPQRSPTKLLTDTTDGLHPRLSAKYLRDAGTKTVLRPEHTYADDPEMLARELAARERKFNVAPAYNKGGDVFVTEESLQALLSSNKRRS